MHALSAITSSLAGTEARRPGLCRRRARGRLLARNGQPGGPGRCRRRARWSAGSCGPGGPGRRRRPAPKVAARLCPRRGRVEGWCDRAQAFGVVAGEQRRYAADGDRQAIRTDAGGGAGHGSQVRQRVRHGVLLPAPRTVRRPRGCTLRDDGNLKALAGYLQPAEVRQRPSQSYAHFDDLADRTGRIPAAVRPGSTLKTARARDGPRTTKESAGPPAPANVLAHSLIAGPVGTAVVKDDDGKFRQRAIPIKSTRSVMDTGVPHPPGCGAQSRCAPGPCHAAWCRREERRGCLRMRQRWLATMASCARAAPAG